MNDDDLTPVQAPSPEEVTRDLRRAMFLNEALDFALADIHSAFAAPDQDRALRGVLHRHLGLAFDEACSRETDLKQAVGILRSQVELLKKNNRELLKRISSNR